MLVNPYTPGTPEYGKWEVQKALAAARDVQENDKANISAVQDLKYGKSGDVLQKLDTLSGQTALLGAPISQLKYRMAEGGEIPLSEATGSDMSADMPVGDMSLLVADPNALEEDSGAEDSTVGYLDGLRDILGEEDYMQLESAMTDYPVVETVARMAVASKDNDGEGEVDGLGGGTDDMVPARLSPGEFIFSKEAVDVIGVGVLEQMHEQAKQEAAMQV